MQRFRRMVRPWLLAGFVLGIAGAAGAQPTEADSIRACLGSWGQTPFAPGAPYKVLSASVKVMGIGVDVKDEEATPDPQLVLVKSAVNVLGKSTYTLLNPQGWYCFEQAVTVLAKSVITAHCNAHLASSTDGVAVAGGNTGTEGVTVLGKAVVKRVGCTAE